MVNYTPSRAGQYWVIQVKVDGGTGFSEGWHGCSKRYPKGEARGKSWGALNIHYLPKILFFFFQFSTLFVVLFGPMKQQWRNIGINVFIKVFLVNIWVKYIFYLAKKVVIYAIFWGKTVSENMCPCKDCGMLHIFQFLYLCSQWKPSSWCSICPITLNFCGLVSKCPCIGLHCGNIHCLVNTSPRTEMRIVLTLFCKFVILNSLRILETIPKTLNF